MCPLLLTGIKRSRGTLGEVGVPHSLEGRKDRKSEGPLNTALGGGDCQESQPLGPRGQWWVSWPLHLFIVLWYKPCLSGQCSWAFYLFLNFGDRSHCVAKADLKLIAIPQPQPSEFWDDRPVSPYEVSLGISEGFIVHVNFCVNVTWRIPIS